MENDNTTSSANIEHIDNIDNIDNTELPLVTALTTPFPQTIEGPHATILRKIKEREREIQKYKRQIQELDFAIAIQESYNMNIGTRGAHTSFILSSTRRPRLTTSSRARK
jgi:hypothetical protein